MSPLLTVSFLSPGQGLGSIPFHPNVGYLHPVAGVALKTDRDAGSEMLRLERNLWAVLGGGCEPGCWFSFWTLTNAAWRPRAKG